MFMGCSWDSTPFSDKAMVTRFQQLQNVEKIFTKIFAEKLKSLGQKKFLLHRTGQDTACVAQGLLAGAQEPFFTAPLCFRAR